MRISKLYNLDEGKKRLIDKIINIYLWGFAVSLLYFIITEILFFVEIPILTFIIGIFAVFFATTPIIVIPIFLIIFRRMHGIKNKIYNKNKISFTLEKYLKIVTLVFFIIVIPAVLIFLYFLKKDNYYLIYNYFILLSSIIPIAIIYVWMAIYNLITNIKQKTAWKKFGINIIIYIFIFIIIDRIIKILFGNL